MEGEAIIAFVIIGVFSVGIFYVVFWLINRNLKKIELYWGELRDRYELKLDMPDGKWAWFMGNYPSLEGNIKGMKFKNYMYVTGSGKHQTSWTAFSIDLNISPNRTMSLYNEGFFSKVGKAFGGQDIQVGNQAFDETYIIKGDDEAFVKKVLNPRVKEMFLREMPKIRGTFKIENGLLMYDAVLVINNERNKEEWEDTIDIAIRFAEEIKQVR